MGSCHQLKRRKSRGLLEFPSFRRFSIFKCWICSNYGTRRLSLGNFLVGRCPNPSLVDFDLSVPNTWFEYECEWWQEQNIIEDQMTLPEDERPFPTPKHANANRELFVPQEKLQEIEYYKDPEWVPDNTQHNLY